MTNMLVIHPSTLISPIGYNSPRLSGGNEVCVCVVCLSPGSPLPIMGFLSDCGAAIISSHSGLDCQLNAQIVVVNSVHLSIMCPVCVYVYFEYILYPYLWIISLDIEGYITSGPVSPRRSSL